MRTNKATGFTRTSPVTEAVTAKETGARPKVTTTIFKCNKCDFETKEERILTGHMTAHGKQDYPVYHCCDHCDYSFKTAGLLRRHLKLMHQNVDLNEGSNVAPNMPKRENLTKCDDCEYKAKSIKELIEHKEEKHVQRNKSYNRTCKYWLRGECVFGSGCYFDHVVQNQWKNNRNDVHDTFIKEYWFQQKCLRENCPFQHFSNSFLENSSPDINSYQEFPQFPTWTQDY